MAPPPAEAAPLVALQAAPRALQAAPRALQVAARARCGSRGSASPPRRVAASQRCPSVSAERPPSALQAQGEPPSAAAASSQSPCCEAVSATATACPSASGHWRRRAAPSYWAAQRSTSAAPRLHRDCDCDGERGCDRDCGGRVRGCGCGCGCDHGRRPCLHVRRQSHLPLHCWPPPARPTGRCHLCLRLRANRHHGCGCDCDCRGACGCRGCGCVRRGPSLDTHLS